MELKIHIEKDESAKDQLLTMLAVELFNKLPREQREFVICLLKDLLLR